MTLADLGWDSERAAELPPDTAPARVVASHGIQVLVASESGERMAPLRRLPEPPAVGDWVALDAAGAVAAILPRRSVLEREGGVMAANIDVVLVIAPCDAPGDSKRLERFAALAPDPVLVVTKADLGNAEAACAAASAAVPDAPVVVCSARTGEGIEDVRALLAGGRTGVLVGRSGAGKSSLANALLGAEVQAVAAVRARDAEGRHTTTHRALLPVPGGGSLVDMPGLKLPRMAVGADIAAAFGEVETLALGCRFSDCAHGGEPGCAVRDAVDPERLATWRRLSAEREAAELARRRRRYR